ncbi:hypothetical protein DEIGR_101985 [Deinococcus grandis]|uniref:Uncharacterized protein n=1 Tax=Deinococcus grandis TaxID=57498 RepID=A0A100HJK3_9DEIO|nr:hypothetical protein [Deinococcus grandis]BBN94543.1 hypothetical protein DEGR_12760 [Deinococcus grandis]GAQ21958.1 hypothetical protein DEIGR_101985 [Deinococcus grandis]
MSFLLGGIWRAALYTTGSVLVFLATLLVLRVGEASRLSEAWFSPQALWRNLEATGTDFVRLGVLTLLPAALLGGRHGVAALMTVVLLAVWSAVGVGTLTLLPLALAGIALTALIDSVRRAVRRHRARVRA